MVSPNVAATKHGGRRRRPRVSASDIRGRPHPTRRTPATRRRPQQGTTTTLIITTVLGAGLAVGAIVGLAAWRWPRVGSPHFRSSRLGRRLAAHPRLARLLRADPAPQGTAGVALIAVAACWSSQRSGSGSCC